MIILNDPSVTFPTIICNVTIYSSSQVRHPLLNILVCPSYYPFMFVFVLTNQENLPEWQAPQSLSKYIFKNFVRHESTNFPQI